MFRASLLVALAFAMVACQRDTTSAAQSQLAQPTVPVTSTEPRHSNTQASIVGRYTCHGACQGISHTLELRADGSYRQSGLPPIDESVQGSEAGQWNFDQEGRRLALAPANQAGSPLYFDVLADGEITLVGTDGMMVDMAYTLKRVGG